MLRDMDVIRSLLLELEKQPFVDSIDVKLLTDALNLEKQIVNYHLILLYQAQYIEGMVLRGECGLEFGEKKQVDFDSIDYVTPTGLTWAGHEYLETVRDPEIWRKTKAGAVKLGSLSVDVIKELAKGFIKQRLKLYTGVDTEI